MSARSSRWSDPFRGSGANTLIYLTLVGVDTPRAPLALAIIGIAIPYAVWGLVSKPYERYPLLRLGVYTLVSDVVLITLWVLGTGGTSSEFWVIYIISVVSVAMRYDLAQTIIAAVLEGGIYAAVMAAEGMRGAGLAVRPTYIVIAGMASGLLARMERINREGRFTAEALARENERLLKRERLAVERLQELDRLKTEFVEAASHELRTPLTTLAGWAQTLAAKRDSISDQDLRAALESMGRQGERVRTLVDNLLNLSGLESEQRVLDLQQVNMREVVDAAIAAAPPPPGVRLTVDIPSDLSAIGDRARLEQVVTNLLSNAYRYGGPNVRILSLVDERVTVLIEDDGRGIPFGETEAVFEPFARGSNVIGSAGSGLGLTVSSRMLAACGGTLTYDHRPEGGSEFKLTLERPDSSAA